ncbi:hypothetical protein [Corynebacterium lubricantis]|uniref:hypothetical protein n=1 Tax=Corynebacterium lubricantis TaxID=541095 RepID=UPI0003AA8BD8|nr:hypothetical protein [Corynebacterium lubricantis]
MIKNEIFHHAEMLLESGGTYGNSATSALGRPSLDSWDLFTRETLQNSWDARDRTSTDDGVTFSIDYAELRGHRADTLREFFDSRMAGVPKLAALLDDPARPNIPVLRICDTGTSGLQGPTSAAQQTAGRNDFASFVRNIGRPSDKEMRGGTYGFGKGVFFDMSDVDTILVYTRTVDERGLPSNRFIAMANSESFNQHEKLFTGRHWWGVKSFGRTGNEFAEPITGIEADSLARALQMDEYFTEERPTGTTITLLAPRTNDGANDGAIDDVLRTIANALTKWAWPHMTVKTNHQDEIDFSVTNNGVEVEIPDPNKDPILRPFVRAYKTSI